MKHRYLLTMFALRRRQQQQQGRRTREKKQQSHLIFPFQVCQVDDTVIAEDMAKCIDTNQYCCVCKLINLNAYLILPFRIFWRKICLSLVMLPRLPYFRVEWADWMNGETRSIFPNINRFFSFHLIFEMYAPKILVKALLH